MRQVFMREEKHTEGVARWRRNTENDIRTIVMCEFSKKNPTSY